MTTTLTPSVIVSNTSSPGIIRYLTTLSDYKIYKILYTKIFYCSRKKSATEESWTGVVVGRRYLLVRDLDSDQGIRDSRDRKAA